MNKKLKIIIPAIVGVIVAIVAIVAVLLVVNNNQTEQVKGTTTEVVKTTLKEIITTEKETSETETETLTENTEEVAEPTQSTTKTPETTKKPVADSSGNSGDSSTTTQKPVATTQKQETTTKNSTITKPTETKPVDISVMGDKIYGDKARAGLYYTESGKLTTYDKIAEGEWYWYYDKYGDLHSGFKPESTTINRNICEYCGKNRQDVDGDPACMHGGCTRWIIDVNCSCGKKVPAGTCHTCKKEFIKNKLSY